jgi:predicted ATPase
MESIRIKNLRSLKDTQDIRFKGLTILVGENSAGKSTLIRTFPLIKQSIETETTTPFLWYGNYVDFGSFKESLNRDNEKQIEFRFKFSTRLNQIIYRAGRYMYAKEIENPLVDIEASICIEEREKNDYVSRMNLVVEDNEIDIIINKKDKIDRLTINSEDLTNMVKDYVVVNVDRGIIPSIFSGDGIHRTVPYRRYMVGSNKFEQELMGLIKSNVHNKTGDGTILQIIDSFTIANKAEFNKKIIKTETSSKSWNKFIANVDEEQINHIQNLYLGSLLPLILNVSSDFITRFYKGTYYIAPVRANAERYYRIQNLSVDSVDFQGRNLPMLLANLSEKKREEFSKWVQTWFGFGIRLYVSEGHISVNVIKEKETVNMADCGFGYSQVLPIITQLWLLTYKRNEDIYARDLTLVIEQPELHLHPKLQASLIDAFINCIVVSEKVGVKLKIVIETHSETIVNRVGYLIYKDRLEKEDVNIYIFNKLNTNETEVVQGSYDSEGFLDNWPSGFFDPKED